VRSCAWLAQCLVAVGEFTSGTTHAVEGVRIAETGEHPSSLAVAAWGLGLVALQQGGPTKALSVLEQSLRDCQSWHLPAYFPWVASSLGYTYALSGRMTEALPLLEQAVVQAASLRILADQSLRVAWLSEAYRLAGRLPEATDQALRALELSQVHQEHGNQAWIH
jgi:tetratricopeptide (TPR) repeat protein